MENGPAAEDNKRKFLAFAERLFTDQKRHEDEAEKGKEHYEALLRENKRIKAAMVSGVAQHDRLYTSMVESYEQKITQMEDVQTGHLAIIQELVDHESVFSKQMATLLKDSSTTKKRIFNKGKNLATVGSSEGSDETPTSSSEECECEPETRLTCGQWSRQATIRTLALMDIRDVKFRSSRVTYSAINGMFIRQGYTGEDKASMWATFRDRCPPLDP